MPITPLSNLLRKPENDQPLLDPMEVDLGSGEQVSMEGGAKKTELPDGSAIIELHPKADKPKSDKFNANLAEDMDEAELNRISSEILEGIARDESSRKDHLDMLAEGIKLLGLVIESNNASTSTASAPLEGMSTVRHPLLLEACQLFQANAMGELLPAAGPAKVRDDRPQKPQGLMGHNGGPPLEDGQSPFTAPMAGPPPPGPPGLPPNAMAPPQVHSPASIPPVRPPMGAGLPPAGPMPPAPNGANSSPVPPAPIVPPVAPPIAPEEEPRDELANALEKDFNHYLTVDAKEYVPDTDQMLFKVGFGGLGIKKVYNCPIRRRPVSESVDVEDFIVSNALSDLSNAGRITHKIKMRPSTLKRMQILKQYREVQIGMPTQSESPNSVDQAKAEVAGVQPQAQDPKDADHVLFECYTELDLDEYAPEQFKGKGLPLPYRVTIERDSQKVLEIRRNWRQDDKECLAKEYFVDFVYMRAFGFYGIGLLHMLGNTTKALTALWREFIDAGMFANFPGFLYLKGAGRQLTNQFRVAPGSGVGLDSSVSDIRQAVMPLPYKNPDASFTAFVTHVEQLGQRLGGTANQPVAEGRADAPVGTTLALIEQAMKPVSAVNKRLHNAQAKELMLFKERFRDDPEAFWRFNKRPAMPWQKEQFVKALEDYDLIPVSDPNNPSRLHRAAKGEAYKQLVMSAPQLFKMKPAILKYARDIEIGDVESTMIDGPPPGPQAPPVDPAKMASAQAKVQGDQLRSQTDLQTAQLEAQGRSQEQQTRLQIALVEQKTEQMRLASTLAIHSDKTEAAERVMNMKLSADTDGQMRDHIHEHRVGALDREHEAGLADQGHAVTLATQPPSAPMNRGGAVKKKYADGGVVDSQDTSLLDQAKQQYPVLNNYDIGYKNSPGGGQGYMESWSPTETGTPENPRPQEFPQGQFGVENYRADSRPIDVLADVASHHLVNVDPTVKQAYQNFQGSLQPWQEDILRSQYQHAQQSENEQRPYEDWKSASGVPAYFRGHTFQQWPAEFNKQAYTPEQIQMLDGVMKYLSGGKEPQQ